MPTKVTTTWSGSSGRGVIRAVLTPLGRVRTLPVGQWPRTQASTGPETHRVRPAAPTWARRASRAPSASHSPRCVRCSSTRGELTSRTLAAPVAAVTWLRARENRE